MPGDLAPPVVDTAAGRIGLAVCFDAAFPEHIRRAALAGAEIVAVPMNSPAPPRPTEPIPIEIAIAMAAANASRVYVVQADRTGEERGVRWAQASVIVDPDGSVVAGPADGEALLVADLDLAPRARQVVGRPQRRLRRSPSRAVLPAEHDPGADTPMSTPTTRGLLERLEDGPVICAEGYLFELERRGYLQAGAFVPEVVLEHPEVVEASPRVRPRGLRRRRGVHLLRAPREAARDRQGARARADQPPRARDRQGRSPRDTGALFAGDICNTNIFDPADAAAHDGRARDVRGAGRLGGRGGRRLRHRRDVLVGEEALIALDVDQAGGPAVGDHAGDPPATGRTREGWTPGDACRRLADAGADVVGLNCIRGPKTMLPLLGAIRAAVDGHVAALPVPVPHDARTSRPSSRCATRDCDCPGERPVPDRARPVHVQPLRDRRVRAATRYALGVSYLGVCCGAAPHHIRAHGRGARPARRRRAATRADMSKHAFLGTDAKLKDHNLAYAEGALNRSTPWPPRSRPSDCAGSTRWPTASARVPVRSTTTAPSRRRTSRSCAPPACSR